ncbi:MAG: hypothetical protein ACJAXU_001127 [Paracoccaceae bacterium]
MLSICSMMVIGTAGLCSFRATEPVIATQIMQGFFGVDMGFPDWIAL